MRDRDSGVARLRTSRLTIRPSHSFTHSTVSEVLRTPLWYWPIFPRVRAWCITLMLVELEPGG